MDLLSPPEAAVERRAGRACGRRTRSICIWLRSICAFSRCSLSVRIVSCSRSVGRSSNSVATRAGGSSLGGFGVGRGGIARASPRGAQEKK